MSVVVHVLVSRNMLLMHPDVLFHNCSKLVARRPHAPRKLTRLKNMLFSIAITFCRSKIQTHDCRKEQIGSRMRLQEIAELI